jgi:predicted RNA-binding Zn ribbon-like protein
VTGPDLIVALANARVPRRPTGARARVPHDGLADAAHATELLAPFLTGPVSPVELPRLHELHRAVSAIIDALIDGSPVPLAALNRLAATHPPAPRLEQAADGTLHVTLRHHHASAAATLARRAISELEALDPTRLRRCGRPECALLFYDVTRSGTMRWHSERPCGLRERQRRHRVRTAAQPIGTI